MVEYRRAYRSEDKSEKINLRRRALRDRGSKRLYESAGVVGLSVGAPSRARDPGEDIARRARRLAPLGWAPFGHASRSWPTTSSRGHYPGSTPNRSFSERPRGRRRGSPLPEGKPSPTACPAHSLCQRGGVW